MSDTKLNLVLEAVARNAAAVLSLPSAGMLRHHKSRFLAESDEGIWVQSVPSERPLVKALIDGKQALGVSFRSGVHRVAFTAAVLRHDSRYPINADTVVEALLLARPTQVKSTQRRANYRVAVGPDAGLGVRVWQIDERTHVNERPSSARELVCELRDISLGGLGVIFRPKDDKRPDVVENDRFRVELMYEGVAMLIEGRMRSPTTFEADHSIRTGIQFTSLEDNLQGRQLMAQLTRIVGTLQREEARRRRLGLSA